MFGSLFKMQEKNIFCSSVMSPVMCSSLFDINLLWLGNTHHANADQQWHPRTLLFLDLCPTASWSEGSSNCWVQAAINFYWGLVECCAHTPLSHQMSLTKHKFRDTIIRNVKMETVENWGPSARVRRKGALLSQSGSNTEKPDPVPMPPIILMLCF
jgi:hypothetical protein